MTEKTEREQFLDDIICTAVEGGIGYWSQVSSYHWGDEKETTVRVHELDSSGSVDASRAAGIPITRNKIEEAITKIAEMNTPIEYLHPRVRGEIFTASLENEAGDIDATLADIIVQVAIFGKVVYG